MFTFLSMNEFQCQHERIWNLLFEPLPRKYKQQRERVTLCQGVITALDNDITRAKTVVIRSY